MLKSLYSVYKYKGNVYFVTNIMLKKKLFDWVIDTAPSIANLLKQLTLKSVAKVWSQ